MAKMSHPARDEWTNWRWIHYRQRKCVHLIIASLGMVAAIGLKQLRSMKAGEKRTISLKPRGESSVMVEFTDKNGLTHKNDLDIYLEPSFGGKLKIVIGTTFSVQSTPP